VASPEPTETFHCCLSSAGQAAGALNPVTLLSRFIPRHCGQSCEKEIVELKIKSATRTLIIMVTFFMAFYFISFCMLSVNLNFNNMKSNNCFSNHREKIKIEQF
jgi:hypothetical protein